MYASVELQADVGSRLQVPASAVVFTGPRRLVFVDLGEGRFRPQEVRLGIEANGVYEVLAGLKAGDRIASSGVFLIAAEARISTAAKYWDNAAPDNAAPMPAPSASAAAATTAAMPMPVSAKRAAPSVAAPSVAPPSPAPSATPAAVYSCPMHPAVKQAGPGKCPLCGMDLVPTPAGPKP
jgi:hypothetical protein